MTKRQKRIVRTKQQRKTTKRRKATKQRRKAAKSSQSHPHDAVFKKIFKRPEYCRALMQVLLMPSLYALFNWPLVKIRESVATGAKGKERRADIVLEVTTIHEFRNMYEFKKLARKRALQRAGEHKSYRDNNTVLQMLDYYNEIAQETGSIILPIIVTCCKDKTATIPSDYLSWALQKQGAPAELKKYFRKFPNFYCLSINLHDLSYRRMRRGGEAVSLALFGMRNYWDMDEDVVAEILKKARLLPQQEREFVLSVLIDYYECADRGFDRKGFAKVERKRYPHLEEKERLMPEMEFTIDKIYKARQQEQQAMSKGKQLGIEQGKRDVVERMLARGMSDEQICDLSQLSTTELAAIKRELKK